MLTSKLTLTNPFNKSLIRGAICLALAAFSASPSLAAEPIHVTRIYWSDGDSGYLITETGRIAFRLSGVDAPESGGVGAAIGGAKCEAERGLSFEAKAFMVDMTRDKTLLATPAGGKTHGRIVVHISVDSVDLAGLALDTGHLKPWPHRGSKALSAKPVWCD